MIALITPTGGRKRQIELCAKYMSSQTFGGRVLWVIVDDCEPTTTDGITKGFRDNWIIRKVYPKPIWRTGDNTQARNILEGLQVVKEYGSEIDAVFIIEDDDYYSNNYLRVMYNYLRGYDLAGELYSIYYHVRLRIGIRNHNSTHSSLFQTAFSPRIIPAFEQLLQRTDRFIDIQLYKLIKNKKLISNLDLAVGIKGLPGRNGIGMGHSEVIYQRQPDFLSYETMKGIIGGSYLNYECYGK